MFCPLAKHSNLCLVLVLAEGGGLCLGGRVLDLRPQGCGFEPYRRHCIVSFSNSLYPLLSTGSTQEDPSRHD